MRRALRRRRRLLPRPFACIGFSIATPPVDARGRARWRNTRCDCDSSPRRSRCPCQSLAFAQSSDATDLDRVARHRHAHRGHRGRSRCPRSKSSTATRSNAARRIRCRNCCAVAPASTSSTRAAWASCTTLFLRGTESDHTLVPGRWRAHRLVDVGTDRAAGHSGRQHRSHRDRARAALEPVRLRGDRRRHPDLHPSREERRASARARRRWAAMACAKPAPVWTSAIDTRVVRRRWQLAARRRHQRLPRHRVRRPTPAAASTMPDPDRDGYRDDGAVVAGRHPRDRCAHARSQCAAQRGPQRVRRESGFRPGRQFRNRATGRRRQAALRAHRQPDHVAADCRAQHRYVLEFHGRCLR